MNTHAITLNEREIRIVQGVIKKYDGIFDPTKEQDSRMLAEHIVKNLKQNKLLKTYNP